MGKDAQKSRRKREVSAGLLLMILAFSYIASLLLDFQFISPYASLQEDLSYLAEHTPALLTSTIAWLVTALLTLLSAPFLFMLFNEVRRFLAWTNLLLMVLASAFFFLMAFEGFRLYNTTLELVTRGIEEAGEIVKLSVLGQFRSEQLYRLLGSSMVGIWALVLGIGGLIRTGIPRVASLFLLAGAPLLVFYNWYDMDHIMRTIALVSIIIGVMLLCFRLIYRGLGSRVVR